MHTKKELLILSPFEMPDVKLALGTEKAGAFPVLHLGRDKKKAEKELQTLSNRIKGNFGICFASDSLVDVAIPDKVTRIIAPIDVKLNLNAKQEKRIEVMTQIYSLKDADKAIETGAKTIIIKGNEGAGRVGKDSSFILFQGIIDKCLKKKVKLYIQGGAGMHSSAAYLALGATGVIFDSQVALFPACSVPKELKSMCEKLSGSETIVVDGFRVLQRNTSPALPPNAKQQDLKPYLGGLDLSKNYIPMGQDISLSIDFLTRYKRIDNLIQHFYEGIYSHLHQAKRLHTISPNNALAKDLGIKYPISQGPMARISDEPKFAKAIADEGALPFLAMSLMTGKPAADLFNETKKLLGNKPWGVGIMGFLPPEIRNEQTKLLIEAKPDIVLIAGGRPSLAKPLQEAGIKTFIHVPSANLLDMYLNEGARDLIFEGRESGGHVGPLSSMVLWEKQIYRLMQQDVKTDLSILFAGGIHDAFSSAFVSIMTSTLAAQGAKIGVQIGTSYLYTKEIVETGAIVEEYQKRILEAGESITLEAIQGQETQSIKSPYTDYFLKEKERMLSSGEDTKVVWQKLEDMNIGRLRIAAKGTELMPDNTERPVSPEEQFERGMYMTGALTNVIANITTIKKIHTAIAVDNNKLIAKLDDINRPADMRKGIDIAVVGMAGIFPGAKDLEEYWKNIIAGKDCLSEVPDERWNKELFFDPNTRDTDFVCSKWGGFIPFIDFDPLEFGITPQSLASIEPVQLLSLLAAKRAMRDAGYEQLSDVDAENTSVMFGVEGTTELGSNYGMRAGAKQAFGEIPEELKKALPRLNEDSFAGVLSNVVAGRIANRLNLGGRNYTVDAACASSLAALDVGYYELATGRSDMVLVGGADFHNGVNDFLMFNSTYALSRKGYCASFDAESDGMTLGEGIGVVVLKRLEDAERDGNKIYAVIKGIGGSSDGKSLGLTAPNSKGQIRALERAYQCAGILPSEVGMIEAHGTGTVVGDRTELAALTDMFLDSGAVPGQTYLGSVKTQIGHAKCAAGIAGLIKAVYAVNQGIIPPTIHLNKPNTFYNSKLSPFLFNTRAGLWNDERRIAGISAFGFGGTNFHTIIENYRPEVETATSLKAWPADLFIFRGADKKAALLEMNKVKELVGINDTIALKNIAYTLATGSTEPAQIIIVAESIEDLLAKMDLTEEGKPASSIFYLNPVEGKTAFLFSGQGSQRVDMARDLFVAFPPMRKLLAKNKEYERILFPETIFDEETKVELNKTITDTRNAQPLLGIVDMAIAEFLNNLGIKPDMVAGHSYGELAALCFAGAFDEEDLPALSRKRAESILDAIDDDKGKMIAVNIPKYELDEQLKGVKDVWAVNFNSTKQIVLAGTTRGIKVFTDKLTAANIGHVELNVACAFHSPVLAKSKDLYAKVLKDVKFSKPTVPVWSNTTAELYPEQPEKIKERLADHLVKPVLFSEQITNMYADGARIFIEAGPGRVLIGLAQNTLGTDIAAIQMEAKDKQGVTYMLQSLGRYIATGREIDYQKLFEDRDVEQIDLDNPQAYKKNVTMWHINGQYAAPLFGKMPADGSYPITKPIQLKIQTMENNTNPNDIMLEYLKGMNSMIHNQRDVMMGYLGYTQPMASPQSPAINGTYAPAQPVQLANQPQTEVAVLEAPAEEKADGANIEEFTPEQIKELLMEVVSDKTGYPIDMLGMDMDLEADLSIDSIKRMEIIGGLKDKVPSIGDIQDSEDAFTKMASIKTLNGIIEWITELQSGAGLEGAETAAEVIEEPKAEVAASVDENDLARLCFNLQPHPIADQTQLLVEGKKFAIMLPEGHDTACGEAILKALKDNNAEGALVADGDDLKAYDGLLFANINSAVKKLTIKELFKAAKNADMERLKWLYAFDDLFSEDKDGTGQFSAKDMQGFSGFVKTLGLEYKGLNVRNVISYNTFNAGTLAQMMIDEARCEDASADIIYKGSDRFHYEVQSTELKLEGEAHLRLDQDSTVLVLGGAQGIAPELISQLAGECPCRYILVGRSTQNIDKDSPYYGLKTREEIRKFLISEKVLKTPAEIEKKVQELYKSSQIAEAVAKVEAAGGKAEYRAADVSKIKDFKALIKDVKEEYGHIDGVVHSAGILQDKFFADKTWKSFEQVYNTKVNPLQVILSDLLGEIKLLVLFSSVSSSYGNKGQIDYAAANSVFDLTAQSFKNRKDMRVLTFNWGPWKGAGMVSSSLEDEFKKRGVSLIPLKVGGAYFVNELKYGKEPEVLVMGGGENVRNFLMGDK